MTTITLTDTPRGLHVAAANDLGDITVGRVIEQFGGKSEFPRFEDTGHNASATLLFRATTFYAKFHRLLLIKEISVFEGLSSYFFGFVKA